MNIFQAANGAATFLILGALVPGIARHLETIDGSPVDYLLANRPIVLLGLFIVLFRIKTLLDDHKHFGEAYQDTNVFRYAGFMLAILSWIFWGLAAYLLPSTIRSSELMAVSILLSTSWVAVHVIEILVDKNRREKEAVTSLLREKWIVINVLYMLSLVGHVGWFRPVIVSGASEPLVVLLLVLAYDILTSRTLKDILNAQRAGG